MAISEPQVGLRRSDTLNTIETLPMFNTILAENVEVAEAHWQAEFLFLCACLPRRILKFCFLHVGTVNIVGFGKI